MKQTDKRRIAILGAGPAGLETALYARSLGHDVVVYEKGRIGANIRDWGHIRLFTPWNYNRSPLDERRLREELGTLPGAAEDHCPTGTELVADYLTPIAALPEMRGVVREHCEVLSCGGDGLLKKDMGVDRAAHPFRILLRAPDGRESVERADIIVDATGVYGEHNSLGDGGIPAPGESALEDQIDYNPPDIMGVDRARFAGRHTVVTGAGFSGATTAVALAELMREASDTRVTWICQGAGAAPLKPVPGDTLAERRELTATGNRLALDPPDGFEFIAGHTVAGLEKANGHFTLNLANGTGAGRTITADRLVANVGYHPNARIYRQLQVHECFATLGPMALAALLMGQAGLDCMAIQSGGADVLRTPEPDFYLLGAKSYGTNPNFLIRLGHEHISQLFTLIEDNAALNLYAA